MAAFDRHELEAYLQALAGRETGASFLEIRYRVGPDALASEFFAVRDRLPIAAAVERRAASTDVYVGCAPRSRRSGTKRDITRVWTLWAECDGADAARAARQWDPEPAIIVRSGSGDNVHAYWPLREPLCPQDAERANLRLAHAIGADRACFDAGRILRPPGSWNHKHEPPTPVTTLRLEPTITFDASEVVRRARPIESAHLDRRWEQREVRDVSSDPLLQIEPPRYVSELLAVDARAGRKVRCPFHIDVRPSLHVYPTARQGWCCFSCGRGGSVYDLAAALWLSGQSAGRALRGREFIEVRERLMATFFGRDAARARGESRGLGLGD